MISKHPIYHLLNSNIKDTYSALMMGQQIPISLMIRCSKAKKHLCKILTKNICPKFNHEDTDKSRLGNIFQSN